MFRSSIRSTEVCEANAATSAIRKTQIERDGDAAKARARRRRRGAARTRARAAPRRG